MSLSNFSVIKKKKEIERNTPKRPPTTYNIQTRENASTDDSPSRYAEHDSNPIVVFLALI